MLTAPEKYREHKYFDKIFYVSTKKVTHRVLNKYYNSFFKKNSMAGCQHDCNVSDSLFRRYTICVNNYYTLQLLHRMRICKNLNKMSISNMSVLIK